MRLKKVSLVFSVVIIVLLLLIGLSVSNILDRGTKEVKVAKKFIEELYDSKIIEEIKAFCITQGIKDINEIIGCIK